jgi:hypothetical protein
MPSMSRRRNGKNLAVEIVQAEVERLRAELASKTDSI